MATFMEKEVLIELISHILGLTSKTVEFENPDRLSLIYKRDELYGLKPEDIEYQKEIKFIKDKQYQKALIMDNIDKVKDLQSFTEKEDL